MKQNNKICNSGVPLNYSMPSKVAYGKISAFKKESFFKRCLSLIMIPLDTTFVHKMKVFCLSNKSRLSQGQIREITMSL